MLHLDWASCYEFEEASQSEWLSLAEQLQLLALGSPRRKGDWLVGRLTAKRVLQQFFRDHGYPLLQRKEIEIFSVNGAPLVRVNGKRMDEISLSIAHSHGHALAGVAQITNEGRIGVDLERIRPVHSRLACRVLTSREREALCHVPSDVQHEELILYWVLKEAAIKAIRPLLGNLCMNQIEVEIDKHKRRAGILFSRGSEEMIVEAQYEKKHGFFGAYALVPPESMALIS